MRRRYPRVVFVSALRGINVQDIFTQILNIIEEGNKERYFRITPPDYRIEAEFHTLTEVRERRYREENIFLRCSGTQDIFGLLLKRYEGGVTEIPLTEFESDA